MATSEDSNYDFIIVGGGTAGLVLAARLSEDPDVQVLVVETGVDQKDDPRVLTPALWSKLMKTEADWAFDTVPQKALGGRNTPFPHGRLLGGTSAINGLVFTPVPKSNVEGWAALGNPGWEWESFDKSFQKVFTLTDNKGHVVGNGPLQVSYPDQSNNNWPAIWKETLAGLSFSVSGDCLFKTGAGNGLVANPECVHPVTKQRSFAHTAYLVPALERSNLTALTGVTVGKVVFGTAGSAEEDVVAEGIQYRDGNKETKIIKARKEVILAAGVFNSPALLERSGIGSAELLSKLGVEVVVDNPNVGENLQNHVIVTVASEVKQGGPKTLLDDLRRGDLETIAAAMAAYYGNPATPSGPFATAGTSVTGQLPFPEIHTDAGKEDLERILDSTLSSSPESGGLAKVSAEFVRAMLSSPDEAAGCYITIPGWAMLNPDGTLGTPPADTADDSGFFSIALLSTHPLSRGSTHITSSYPTSESTSNHGIAIDPGYLSHPLDVEVFARNLRFLETILATEPLAAQLKAVRVPPAGGFKDLDVGKSYVKNFGLGGNHFVGSCAMVPREMGGVVDPCLRVYGTKNLRVCDASIIPLIPRANPQAAVYGIAEHGAAIIKKI
ncbi:hypothetical protein B0H66DRAFT_257056 [Apodospora peruviana]|uniref:GMC oxidoreductase n=1 Tax=Apodospora peruviana TaxID=516989 RepID=A0AAE0M561_9PEZI|nr:hypothetical protein B0H66DRAFT_257056 [Apodospora peruviana]